MRRIWLGIGLFLFLLVGFGGYQIFRSEWWFTRTLWPRFEKKTGCKVTADSRNATVDARTCRLPLSSAIKQDGSSYVLERETSDQIMKGLDQAVLKEWTARCEGCSREELQRRISTNAVAQQVYHALECSVVDPQADWTRFCDFEFTVRVDPFGTLIKNMDCSQVKILGAMGDDFNPWRDCKQ